MVGLSVFYEFQTIFEFWPLMWNLGDDLVVFWFGIEGAMVHPFAFFSGSDTLAGCLHCSLVSTTMPPH